MKNLILKSFAIVYLLTALVAFNSCQKDDGLYDPIDIDPVSIGYSNDGPLSTVTNVCDVLVFTDQAHFESVYQYLDNRYTTNEPRDSTASLDAFERDLGFSSRRTYIEDWEEDMENQNIPIDASNDIDTLLFGETILQTLVNPKGILVIGNDAVMILDECLWVRVPFNDCQGIMLLEQVFDQMHNSDEAAQADLAIFMLQKNILVENRCPAVAGSRSSGCGFLPDFSYTTPVLNPSNNRYEFTLTDLTQDYLTNSSYRKWSVVNNDPTNLSLFTFFWGTNVHDIRKNAKISVPANLDCITIRLVAKQNIFSVCEEVIEKKICFNCPYPDWNRVDEYSINFFTRNATASTQVLWKFGDASTSTSTSLNPTFTYNVTCLERFLVNFAITSNPVNCPAEFPVIPINAGPMEYLSFKTASKWYTSGSEKFKWKIRAVGQPNLSSIFTGNGKVRGFIKYKSQNSSGKWRKKRTTLKIEFLGNIYDENCNILNSLSSVSSPKTKNNKKRMKHKYTTNTPFRISMFDPIKATFTAGGISATFDVFD